MPYPKTPNELKKKGVGVSLTGETIKRVTVLAGGLGERSRFLGEMIVIGLESKYGPKWTRVADSMQAETENDLDERQAA